MQLQFTTQLLCNGLNSFKIVNPSLYALPKALWLRKAFVYVMSARIAARIYNQQTNLTAEVGNYLARRLIGNMLSPINSRIAKLYSRASHKQTSYSNIDPYLDADASGRIVKNMNIVYHDADRAGRHLDIHIGRFSLIMRIPDEIVTESTGRLSQRDKEVLLALMREKLRENKSFVQNRDHTIYGMNEEWLPGSSITGYGAGKTRQVISRSKAEVYGFGDSIRLYAPVLFPDRGTFLFQLGDTFKWGLMRPNTDQFEPKLKMKLVDTLPKKGIYTRKYDGASTYFVSYNDHMKLFSPRVSKTSGYRIEYTYKLPELVQKGYDSVIGMGEVLFWKPTVIGHLSKWLLHWRSPEHIGWNYLTAAEIGGVLNSNSVRPSNIYPELRVYRIDKLDGASNLKDYRSNRDEQHRMIVNLHSYWKVVRRVFFHRDHWEGLVIDNLYKYKLRGDTNDWTINDINLYVSDTNTLAGNIECKSESGRTYYLGPNQIGPDLSMSMMEDPNSYKGRVLKVASFNFEGRASKVTDLHSDK